MSTFTEDFFSKNSITKTNTSSSSTKTKKKEIDVDDFTNSFFSNYNLEEENNKIKNDSYNLFVKAIEQEKINIENTAKANKLKRDNEQANYYYENNKESLKEKRSTNLIYNWNLQDSGGVNYDYGSVPIQNDKGYLKKTDSNGNIYWIDDKNNLLYDANGKLINDDRLKDSKFINSLKYEYDENSKSNINTKALNNKDKLGLVAINSNKYQFLVDNETNENKKLADNWNKQNTYLLNYNLDKYKAMNPNLRDKNIIVSDGKLYEVIEDNNTSKLKEVTDFGYMPNNYMINNPYQNKVSLYDTQFEKLNKALEKGDLTTANNALQVINNKYFGHEYADGWWSALFDSNKDDRGFFQTRFEDNVEKLNIINDTINNTYDSEVLSELEKEKNKLELENTLIQYNRLCSIHSDNNLINKMDNIMNPVDESWNKVGTLWSETFKEFKDGYNFGDIFKTAKHTLNNTFQTIGTLGKQTNASIQGIETLMFSNMDDSTFKEVWAPAIVDVATYIIPYVGQARMAINYAEPASTVEAFITQEGSATIDSKDGTARKPNVWNAAGASINIAANYASDLIFSKIRANMNPETLKKLYSSSGKAIALEIFKEGTGEGIEEFIQTYAEYMQNMDDNISLNFFKEHFTEALQSATIAAVTSSGASATGVSIGAIRGKLNPKSDADVVDNIRINRNIKEDNNKTIYTSTDIKNYEDIKYDSNKISDVTLDTDENAVIDIAEQLENGNIITFLDTDSIKVNNNTDIDNEIGNIKLSDSVINDNIKTVLVSSKEMETYLKSLRDDLTVYVIDPKSDTFMDDVRNYVNDINKSNIITKNVSDFIPSDYKFTPNEMNDINKMVNEYINIGNVLDSNNNPNTYKLNPITTSDITDSDINTIMNSIKTKFLNEIDSNRISKETAQKEFKSLSNKLSDYTQKTKENRTYIKDDKGSIITFAKRGSNMYEAVNTIPSRSANLEVFANVMTNGNIINGNLNKKITFTKKQLNALNTLIDKLGLKGNYLTNDSIYKDLASLIKQNKDFSKEILQSLGADGLIEGKIKTRLYTAYDNLDNSNPRGAIQNTIKEIDSKSFNEDIKKDSLTIAPKIVNKTLEQSKADINKKPISTKDYAYNPNDTTELNNIDAEKFIDDIFKDIKITDKKTKEDVNELKTKLRKILFDRYIHINDIAKPNNDYNVREAISNLESVASDAQQMISGAQIIDNEIVGKSLNQIYSNLKGKKEIQAFEKYMMLELNIERENAGVEKIFDNLSKEKSRKAADVLLNKHPKFKEIANDLQRYNNNLLNMLVDGGVINESLSNKLKDRYKYYMPIYSSELSTFADLASDKYFKNMKVDDTIKDVTKTGKKIQSLKKSMENKTYNVLSAIAKNKLAIEMANSGKYESSGNADMIYYKDGIINKMKTSQDIVKDITDNSLSHIVDTISEYPVLKQLIGASNLSYKFILDPIYQVKNVVIDFTDSQLIYSKDKKNFAKNYARAVFAVANNSEIYNEFKEIGLANFGTGIMAPNVSYNEDGTLNVKQNKFQRLYSNLETLPKLAEYLSLKDKYMKQAKKDNNISFKNIQEQIKLKAKIDAQDVNLNFNSGGTGSKALSKAGFKFLNAGMLGLDKFVTHVSEGVKTPKGMGSLLFEFTAIGIGTAVANALINGEDEDYDKLPYYYKNNYYMFKISDGKYFRIPKGRVQTLYNVLFEYATGIREEDDTKTYLESIKSAFELAVLPPALEEASPWAVYSQLITNKDAFGNEIYSNKYDSTEEKLQKGMYHLLSNYFGRYGRMVKDITDGDSTTDLFNEFDYYKDTTKANRHYSTVLNLVEYYQNKDNVKTLDDKAIKKYIDTQNYNLRSINSEINQSKKSGQNMDDMKMLYASRDDLLLTITNNYKNFDKEIDSDGNTWYYFDDHCFVYNEKTEKFTKKY